MDSLLLFKITTTLFLFLIFSISIAFLIKGIGMTRTEKKEIEMFNRINHTFKEVNISDINELINKTTDKVKYSDLGIRQCSFEIYKESHRKMTNLIEKYLITGSDSVQNTQINSSLNVLLAKLDSELKLYFENETYSCVYNFNELTHLANSCSTISDDLKTFFIQEIEILSKESTAHIQIENFNVGFFEKIKTNLRMQLA